MAVFEFGTFCGLHIVDMLLWMGAYLVGSIPWGLLLVKMLRHVDVRHYGSGNIGATNVYRVAGCWPAIVTFLLDSSKGMVALGVSLGLGSCTEVMVTAALLSVVGHMYPVWLGFRGGKGVATSFAVVLGLAPVAAGVAVLVWLGTMLWTRTVSLASMAASLVIPLVTYWTVDHPAVTWGMLAMSCLVLWAHRTNWRRWLRGQEPAFSLGAVRK